MDNNGNHPDGNVIVQMEISLSQSSLKTIVDSENVQLIPDGAGGSPSSSSERSSISAAIVSSPPQPLDPAPTTENPPPPPPPPPSAASTGGSNQAPPPPPQPSAPTAGGSNQAPPPPPPFAASKGGDGGGGAPPPPPAVGNGGKLLRKSVSKLRRSSQMGCLYRQLKAKVEGSGMKTNTLQKKDSKVGVPSGGSEKKGMADALAEMTKRSSYFQQIEEDVKNYSDSIKEVKSALISFQTPMPVELVDQ